MSAVFDVAPEHLVARARLELLFDSGTFKPTRSLVGDGVLSGSGRVNGRVVCAWAQDGSFKGGSLGTRGGETIARTIGHAEKIGAPVVGFPNSGGARLQEGVAALHAYSAIFRAQALATVPQIGIIANQPKHLGGCLDAESSQKGAWFVDLCDRFGLPLVVLVDTPGFLPGVGQEKAGVIRHGASLLRAFSVATTPRVTVTLRQAYGGAHIVMNSRDLGADLTLAWPDAKIGVMGPSQAVEIMHRREIAAGADPAELADAYAAEHLPVAVAASRGYVDEIVEPYETRERIAFALEAAR